MNRYHINIFWSDEDGEFIAAIPDLVSCSASGATPEGALREVLIAQELWLDVAREHGWELPEPRYRPGVAAS